MKSYVKAGVWFVAFEILFWGLGVKPFGEVFSYFVYGRVLNWTFIILGIPVLLLSVMCFALFVKNVASSIRKGDD